MWILSQDKTILMNVETLHTKIHSTKTSNGNYNCDYAIKCNQQTFGYYSTKEKALKVLDEIRHSIYICELSIRTHDTPYEQDLIYQMPQDSEVD